MRTPEELKNETGIMIREIGEDGGNGVNYEMNYCSYCGQHLDWSESN